jgi:hypothetical protein
VFYVGLDIHTKRISICVLSETGQLVRRCQVRGIPEMLSTLKALPDRFEVCYEASCGYGHYHDLLQPLAARVLVAHPGRLRLIFRSRDTTTARTRSGKPSSCTWARRRRSACPRSTCAPGAD